MAYYNHGAAIKKKERADKYAELKKHITSKDDSGKLNEEQKKENNEYKIFFSLMRKLLPKTSHNVYN